MAFNISIENTITLRKGEQAKIHESGQLCAEILNVLSSQPRLPLGLHSETEPLADTSPMGKEEMDLLEKALEKALQVRSGSKRSVTRPNTAKTGTQCEQSVSTKAISSSYKRLTKSKSSSKTTEQKDPDKYQRTICHTTTKQADGLRSVRTNDPKITHGIMTSTKPMALPDLGQHTLPYGFNNQKMKSAQLCGKDCSAITDSSRHSAVSFSKTMEPDRNCWFQHDEISKWINLKHKENRLWDKVVAFETNSSSSGRDLFMERMKGTSNMRLPCGSPEKIQVLMHRLIQQGQGLPENRQTNGAMALQTPGDGTTRGAQNCGGEGNQDFALKSDRLKMTLNNIRNCAFHLKREWESWDRWRPQWGCLCSIGTESEWHEGRPAPLPKTITYSMETELTELETLRMKVALLQQESFVEKILSDTLSPFVSSAVCATVNPSLLRDLYSVLGEGGERFPAIVLDSEPDS